MCLWPCACTRARGRTRLTAERRREAAGGLEALPCRTGTRQQICQQLAPVLVPRRARRLAATKPPNGIDSTAGSQCKPSSLMASCKRDRSIGMRAAPRVIGLPESECASSFYKPLLSEEAVAGTGTELGPTCFPFVMQNGTTSMHMIYMGVYKMA